MICERLKIARRTMGYTSARIFAIKNMIPASTYAQHESGARNINIETMLHYCGILSISTSWLLTGTGDLYDVNITKQQACNEVDNKTSALATNKVRKNCFLVDIDLLTSIFVSASPLLRILPLENHEQEISQHCFDIYDAVISSQANITSGIPSTHHLPKINPDSKQLYNLKQLKFAAG